MTTIPPSVLIVRLDAIGDALTTVPLIAALRRCGVRVGAVLRRSNADAFSNRALDTVHLYPCADLAGEIQRERYAAALIPTEKVVAYRIAAAARIPIRIGFENGWGKPLKTLWVRRLCTRTIFRPAGLDERAPHECEVVFGLARPLIGVAEPPREPAVLRPLVIDRPSTKDGAIAIQITDKWERLGAARNAVIDLVRRIAAHHELTLIGADAEREYCRTIAQAAGFTVQTFGSLREWKERIDGARALVAPDCGAVHVAGMIGTPVVACFAREHFRLNVARWSPWAAPFGIVMIEGEEWPLSAADALRSLLSGTPKRVYTG